MAFRILGSLEVLGPDGPIALGGPKRRGLLALLVVKRGQVLAADRIAEELRDADAERTRGTVQTYVSQLRKLLVGVDGMSLTTRPGGYVLELPDSALDAAQFETTVCAAAEEDDLGRRVELCDAALGLWRGTPLEEFSWLWASAERARLERLRVETLGRRLDARLERGEHNEVLGELERLTGEYPLDERLWGQRMLACYRAGRQGDALRAFGQARRYLGEELGVEPSPALVALEHRILDHDPTLAAPEIHQASPPQVRVARPTHNLPYEVTSFIGRHRELAELRKLVADSRLVTLVGAGGCGKTRLARRLAAELSDASDDGVWQVELASVSDPALVAPTVASVLRVADEPGRPPLERLIDALSNRTILILLDNCEHVLEAAATVVHAILEHCPGVDILATSRESLGVPGEHIYRIPSLAVPPQEVSVDELPQFEAVQLFTDRTAQHLAGFSITRDNAASVASICRRLDGIPLALELAASSLRFVSADEIDAWLDERFRLLTHGRRVAPPRQQTLRAMVDWSYELLTEREGLVFARFSVFAGGWTVDAAEAVAADEVTVKAHDVLGIVSALVDKSLVEADIATEVTRYRFLETMREYAAQQLARYGDDERRATRRRHRDYLLTLIETAAPELRGPDQLEWLDRLELEHDNLRSALGDVDADPSDEATDAGLRIITAAANFWLIRRHILEASELADRILARPQPLTSPLTRAGALLAAAELDAASDHHQRAEQRLHDALALARRHGDADLTSGVLEQLGYEYRLEPARAREFVEESLDVARAAGCPHRVARALASLGTIVGAQGDYRSARQIFGEAVTLFSKLGDRRRLANTYNNLGVLLMEQGDLVEARAALEEACVAERAIGSSPSAPSQNLATIALLEGDADIAERMFAECLNEARRDGHRSGTAYAFLGGALSATLRGDFHRAAALHGVADVVIEQAGQRFDDLEARLRIADLQTLHRALGDAAWQQSYERGRQLTTAEVAAIVLAPPANRDATLTPLPDT